MVEKTRWIGGKQPNDCNPVTMSIIKPVTEMSWDVQFQSSAQICVFPVLLFLTLGLFSSQDPELAPSFPQNCLRMLIHCLWPNIDSTLGLWCKKHLFWKVSEMDSSQAEEIIEVFCIAGYPLALKIQFLS